MGGYGSGRRSSWDKKTTVEEVRHLDIGRWVHEDMVRPNGQHWGTWVWTRPHTGEQTASLSVHVTTKERGGWARLFYTTTPRNGQPIECDYKVPLVTTRPHFGGLRWWFLCPLSHNEQPCLRRVGKLYLPSGGRYYGCRQCYDLTYTSSQESDKRVSHLANDPFALSQFMQQSINQAGDDTLKGAAQLMLALKASRKRQARYAQMLKNVEKM